MTGINHLLPPEIAMGAASPDKAFRVLGTEAFLWFEPGDSRLLVSFDNLATVDDPYPRLPWIHRIAWETGVSFLGVQTARKDWFRNETTPNLITALAENGFFDGFSKVTFIGASMGAFAALTYAPLVAGARVLALSAQSTMNKTIAPFENRFRWAVRNSNWDRPAFLDAAEHLARIPAVSLLYDPFVPEDRAHAARLSGPNVQHVKLPHATHEAIRVVIKSDGLSPMIEEFFEQGHLGVRFRRQMRGRRHVRKWARAFMGNVEAAGQPRRTIVTANALLRQGDYLFARQARERVLAENPDLIHLKPA
jgi:hypothetical protein